MYNKISILSLLYFVIIIVSGCNDHQQSEPGEIQNPNGKINILQAWQGDYPVNQLHLLPEDQRDLPVGYITNEKTFTDIWKQFKPEQGIPDINYNSQIIFFARNVQYYNRISIGQVKLTDGVVEVLAMETMSALPIENNLALSLAVVSRQGIKAIQIGEKTITIQ